MKFICDEMLKKLAAWLRIAGHDVIVLPDGTKDRDIVDKARLENRILLTRDKKIAEFKLSGVVTIILECDDLADCVKDLNHKIHINWIYKPFSRCKSCNTELVKATKGQCKEVPEKVRNMEPDFLFCPVCNQLFWEGSHVENMLKQLVLWNNL